MLVLLLDLVELVGEILDTAVSLLFLTSDHSDEGACAALEDNR